MIKIKTGSSEYNFVYDFMFLNTCLWHMWTIYYLENTVIENNRSLVGKKGEGFENNSSSEEETGEIEEEAACVCLKGLQKQLIR